MSADQRRPPRDGLPRTVWALGFVSLFMDVSSEMIHSLLPIFLVSVLSASATAVGAIEGIAESSALLAKLVSGGLSDRLRRRKALAVAGYGLAAMTKPLFAVAPALGVIFAARTLDRIGKGVRGAPRDALIADVTPSALRGAAYGLRQSLDTVGAFAGPLAAIALMTLTGGRFRVVFWAAVIPALVSVAILVAVVREPRAPASRGGPPLRVRDLARLGRPTWTVIAIGGLFAMARFSEAFLLLRAQSAGLPAGSIPLVLVVMSAVFALTAYPAGRLSDRIGTLGLLAGSLVVLIVADLLLIPARGVPLVLLGAGVWGLHMGLSQGLLAALLASKAEPRLRGTAFGMFGVATAIGTLAASLIAGLAWDRFGPPATFGIGATLAALALAAFVLLPGRAARAR